MKKINPKDLIPSYNIIDIRKRELYLKGHIYNAKNISMDLLIDMPDKYLDKNEVYYIYCTSGYKSQKCCKLLEIQGYNVVDVVGGYEDYIK